jgi:hypothetical protein
MMYFLILFFYKRINASVQNPFFHYSSFPIIPIVSEANYLVYVRIIQLHRIRQWFNSGPDENPAGV